MKIKTSELEGAALDYCTALACGIGINLNGKEIRVDDWNRKDDRMIWSPSTDWSQGGPLLKERKMTLGADYDGDRLICVWAYVGPAFEGHPVSSAKTHLIAVCRAIVAAKLGDTVDVPEGLV